MSHVWHKIKAYRPGNKTLDVAFYVDVLNLKWWQKIFGWLAFALHLFHLSKARYWWKGSYFLSRALGSHKHLLHHQYVYTPILRSPVFHLDRHAVWRLLHRFGSEHLFHDLLRDFRRTLLHDTCSEHLASAAPGVCSARSKRCSAALEAQPSRESVCADLSLPID